MDTTDDNTAAAQSAFAVSHAVRVLLLDDDAANLLLRTALLRQNGYDVLPAGSVEKAIDLVGAADVAVLDYHLGRGKVGPEAAAKLRTHRSDVPLLILSATLEQRLDGPSQTHLSQDNSRLEDLLGALRSLEANRRGDSAIVHARELYYSRIAAAIGVDVLVQILAGDGTWHYVNDSAAAYLQQPRDWFPGKNFFTELGDVLRDWRDVLQAVTSTRETYLDPTRAGLLRQARQAESNSMWSVIAFPVVLHDGGSGVLLSARILT